MSGAWIAAFFWRCACSHLGIQHCSVRKCASCKAVRVQPLGHSALLGEKVRELQGGAPCAHRGAAMSNFGKCRMIGCGYEAAGTVAFTRRAMNEHLADKHGVGRPDPNKTFLGCFYSGCAFQAGGSEADVNKQLREHLIYAHGINPENPEIPADARRPER